DLRRRFGDVEGAGTLAFRPKRGLGRIGDHLLELADAENVDVIAVGTRQKAGLGRISSVSSVILHDAKQTVLCIPRSNDAEVIVPRFKVAVVATDLSEFANRAVPYAYGIVGSGEGAEVHLVHVIDEHSEADEAALAEELTKLAPKGSTASTTPHVVRGD